MLILTIALGIASNASVDGFVRGLLTQDANLPGGRTFAEAAGSIAALLRVAAIAVFVIACANVAHLQLARTSGRRKELAIRSALARAAMRRGSSMMIFLPFNQGASSSASGTRVVLPAPGGATSTAALLAASACAMSPSTSSMGRGVSKERVNG